MVCAAAPCLTGCQSTLASGDIARAAADALASQSGTRPHVTCPDDVPARVGATTHCRLTATDVRGSYRVTVQVTQLNGGRAHVDVSVPATTG